MKIASEYFCSCSQFQPKNIQHSSSLCVVWMKWRFKAKLVSRHGSCCKAKKSTIGYNDGDDYTTMMRHDVWSSVSSDLSWKVVTWWPVKTGNVQKMSKWLFIRIIYYVLLSIRHDLPRSLKWKTKHTSEYSGVQANSTTMTILHLCLTILPVLSICRWSHNLNSTNLQWTNVGDGEANSNKVQLLCQRPP
jgi:hypothetical protein